MKGDVRLLPDEIPRDPIHAQLLCDVAEAKLSPVEAMPFFQFPLIGFHSTLYWLSMHWLAFRQAGSYVFKVNPDLQEALANTSLSGIDPSDVTVPHNTLWLSFPGKGLQVWGGERTKWHKADGAWVSINQGERTELDSESGEWRTRKIEGDDPGALSILIWGSENELSENVGDDACIWWTLDLKEVQDSGLDIEEHLTKMLSDPSMDQPLSAASLAIESRTELPKGVARDAFTEQSVKCTRVIINALLYACTKERILEEDAESVQRFEKREALKQRAERAKAAGKKKRYMQKLGQIRPTRVFLLGGSASQRKKAGEHWVSGHWWPKKSNIRKWLKVANDEAEQTRTTLSQMRGELSKGEAWSVSKTASKLEEVVNLSDLLEQAEERAQDLKETLSKKLRWVAPYKRNKKAEEGDSE